MSRQKGVSFVTSRINKHDPSVKEYGKHLLIDKLAYYAKDRNCFAKHFCKSRRRLGRKYISVIGSNIVEKQHNNSTVWQPKLLSAVLVSTMYANVPLRSKMF